MTSIRYDGVYQSSFQLDVYDFVDYWHYLHFTHAGEVILVTHEGPPEEAATRIRENNHLRRGRYRACGSRVSGRIEYDGFPLIFQGIVDDEWLKLRADDGIGYFPQSDRFLFVPLSTELHRGCPMDVEAGALLEIAATPDDENSEERTCSEQSQAT